MIDAHTHLADPRQNAPISGLMDLWKQDGLTGFIQAGVDPGDWASQLELKSRFPKLVFPVLGLHPYFVAENSLEDCRKALSDLEPLLPQAYALGETGLDFRTQYAPTPEHRKRQSELFQDQLTLAKKMNLPLVLHIVRAHSDALQILKKHAPLTGIVHAFNSNWKNAEEYLRLGLTLSIGPALLQAQSLPLQEVVRMVPQDRLVFESDSPEAPPPIIFEVAKKAAEMRRVTLDQIQLFHYETLIRIFGMEAA